MIHTVASKVILEELSSGSRMETIETYLVNMILMQGNWGQSFIASQGADCCSN